MSNDSYHDINAKIEAEHRYENRLALLRYLTSSPIRILSFKDVQKAVSLDTEVIMSYLLEFKRAGWVTCSGEIEEYKLLGIELTEAGKQLRVLFL